LRRLVDSVRVRLTFAVTVIFAGAVSLASVLLVRSVEATLLDDLRDRNAVIIEALRNTELASNDLNDTENLASDLTRAGHGADVMDAIGGSYFYVVGPSTAIVDSSGGLAAQVRRGVSGEAVPILGSRLPSRIDPKAFLLTEVNVRTDRGSVQVHIATPTEQVTRTVDRVARALYFAVPSMVVAVAALAWFVTGQALRPVLSITRRANEITGSTLHQRVPEPRTDDEIGELARTMNAMLDRIEGSSERQKRFMSDASHELRSPVASIRTQLETALLRPDHTDWPHVGRTVLAEDERLGALVDNLLALTRLEEGVRRPTCEVDLDELCYEQLQRTFRVPIDRSGVLAGRVIGVPDELTSVVRNLIDNAARHAATAARVSLATYGPTVRLCVEDDGPGVPMELREKVFERFTRLQEARSRDAGGSGLGLALTKRIVESHGGRIFVESAALGGAAFVVELPAALADDEDDW
jgi:signal transduction histidine kinase